MSAGDSFLLIVRWLHLLSAAAWVGGGIFYLLVLRPALRRAPESPRALNIATATEFKTLVNACIVILVATGVILGADRLTERVMDAPYAITLGVKSALSVWIFLLVSSERRRSQVFARLGGNALPARSPLGKLGEALSGYNAVVVLGLVVFFLSDLLKIMFEAALSRG